MSDAIALFRPRIREKLVPFLDLDEDDEESDGLYAEELEDGSILVHTFQPYELFAKDPAEGHTWLEQFGEALEDVHDDERGMLFFSDDREPEARTYEGIVEEVGDEGVWIGGSVLTLDALAGQFSPDQMEMLQSLTGGTGSSFEIGQLFQGVQQQILDAFGADPDAAKDDPAIIDAEFTPDPAPTPVPKK